MRVRSFAFVCLLALGAVPAVAADLPARMVTKAPPLAPAFSWTGFYIGGNVGYGFGDTTGTGNPVNYDMDGVFGGGQIGANYQMGAWVFGIEADYQWADIKGSGPLAPGFVSNTEVERFGTVRGRIGYAWERWMVYGTGGYAFSGRTTASFTPAFVPAESQTLSGWAAGVGVEYAFAPNWSAKLEYLHVDLGDRTFFQSTLPGCTAAPAGCTTGAQLDAVRAGVNYRFWGGGAR
jgi:outer membrane immunogenic protein